MKKLVFISNMASPYQVKFCYALQKYYDTEFWFHVYIEDNRPEWWKIDLGNKCKILENVIGKRYRKYLSLNIFKELKKFDPDIILLGGFSFPTNYLSYLWGKFYKKKIILFRETYRIKIKKSQQSKLMKRGLFTKIIHFIYSDLSGVLTSNFDASKQMIEEFKFENVKTAHYPFDIDKHLGHEFRNRTGNFTFLFANRLIDDYNPIFAINIFYEIQKKYPNSILLMNADGNLKSECELLIENLDLKNNIKFLTHINSWNTLHKIYEKSDILIFPAKFSNGNFSIIEAMASGMGIVISDKVLGHGELLKNGFNCFICNLDKTSFCNAIEEYFKNPNLFKKHGLINKNLTRPLSLEPTAKLFFDLLESF